MPAYKYPSHGVLNPIQKPNIDERLRTDFNSSKSFFNGVINKTFTPDSISNTGPYKAIVLRIEKSNAKPTEWMSSFYGVLYNNRESIPHLVQIKARIPEIHSFIPIPKSLGPESPDYNIINMYPTFIAKDDQIITPEIGSVVWVDYINKTNLEGPVYLGPVSTKDVSIGSVGRVSSADSHTDACVGTLSMEQPKGDLISGQNKPISHDGESLLPRKARKEKKRIIKDDNTSGPLFSRWKKALESNEIDGSSWIGNLKSNKERQLIVFSPETTNFCIPVELMYYFHGENEFGNSYDLDKRIVGSIKDLIQNGRNFVLVMPELPWSIGLKKDGPLWSGGEFKDFHNDVIGKIKQNFSIDLDATFISFTATGRGGEAMVSVLPSFSDVKPNKITLAEADYGNYTKQIWEKYVKENDFVEFNLLTGNSSSNKERIKEFYKSIDADEVERITLAQYGVSFREIANLSLTYVNPSTREQNKRILEAMEDYIPPTDEDFIASQEGPAALLAEKNMSQEEKEKILKPDPLPKNDEATLQPASPNKGVSPSYIPKQSKTRKSPPRGARIVDAKPFIQTRVRLEEYGNIEQIQVKLVEVPAPDPIFLKSKNDWKKFTPQKLHPLAAKRFFAMNEAWMKENPGMPPMTISSGYRKPRFASMEEYKEFARREGYSSVAEAREYVAFESPHSTGLAFDLYTWPKMKPGLYADRRFIELQKTDKMYKWMKANAYRFGISPYVKETWHWEVKIPKESWITGEEFSDKMAVAVLDIGEVNYNVANNQQKCVNRLKDFA